METIKEEKKSEYIIDDYVEIDVPHLEAELEAFKRMWKEQRKEIEKLNNELGWFEKQYHHSLGRIKKLEWILEHEYHRKVAR